MTDGRADAPGKYAQEKAPPQLSFSLPMAVLVLGVLLIAASFSPIGNWAAKSQWTIEDSAEFDRVSTEYKLSNYKSPARSGLSTSEWEARREKMRRHMQALQQQLEQAKQQPNRWKRYLLGVGMLLTAAGFYANTTRRS